MDVLDQPEQDVEDSAADDAAETHDTADGKPLRPDFLNLKQERIDQLQSLTNKLNVRNQWARQVEILRCTLKRFFWLGLQHVWFDNDAQCFQVGQMGGAVSAENLNEETTAMQDFDIYSPNGKIFISVFAQNPASIRAEPDQPRVPASQRAAREAEKYFKVYDKYNPAQDAQIRIGQLLWNDGRVISITEASEDGESEVTEYAGVLESLVPIYESSFRLWPYCKVSKDHDILAMRDRHKEVADEITCGTKSAAPNDEIARMARIATAEKITQLSQDSLAYLVTEDRWWLRPSAFSDLPKEDRAYFIGGKVSGTADETKQIEGIFPKGCKLTFCGGTFCGAAAVSMDAALNVLHAEPGEGQARKSLGDPHVPVQMEFNDAMNLTSELLKFCIPSLWADMDVEEFAAIREQLSQYGQIRPKKRKAGEPMESDFYAEPQVEAPMILTEWIENLQGPLTTLVTGNQPALFGGNMEDQKTAKGYQQAMNQSLGLLTIVWAPYQTFAAKIHEQAAKIAAKREAKFSAFVAGKKKNTEDVVEIDPSVLRGGFTCSAIPAQGFPESWTQKSQTWKQLKQAAAQDPSLAASMNLPDNQAGFQEAIGLSEFVIEGADSRDKQLEEWAEMQKGEGPEEDQEATAQRDQQRQQQAEQLAETVQPGHGQTPPPPPQLPPIMKSSIPVDADAEDHVAEGLECFRVLNSPEGMKIKNTAELEDGRKGIAVWTDLKLHMLAHIAAGKAKGLIFPPPLGGPPPMPIPLPGKGAHPGGPGPGAPPIPPPSNPGGLNAPLSA